MTSTSDIISRADAELAVAEAIRRAADMITSSAYTSNGDRRSLEPVADSLRGADQHHATIAAAILALVPADALAELQRLREAVAQRDHVVAAWAEVSQTNYQRAKAAEAERDAALVRVEKLRHQITEASDPDFIWGALDNVHDAETTLDDYAAAVSRAIRGAMQINGDDA
jgi:hypothetical protein